MALSVTKTFQTSAEASNGLFVRKNDSFSYTIDFSADWDGLLYLEKSSNNGINWETVRYWPSGSKTDISTAVLVIAYSEATYRFRCELPGETLTGTAAIVMTEIDAVLEESRAPDGALLYRMTEAGTTSQIKSVSLMINANEAKIGATAGWVVAAADDVCLATCPASQTGATLIVPVSIPIGVTITGFYLVGQIESAANTVTLDANLRKHTAAAADVSDASVASITQISVTADTAITSANSSKSSLTQVVGASESYYFKIAATTGASTDVALQGVVITYTEA